MITVIVIFGQLAFDAVFGWTLLSFYQNDRTWTETLLAGALLGIYVETLAMATLMFAGVSLVAAGGATALGMIGVAAAGFYRGRQYHTRLSTERLKWFEWVSLAVIGETVLFALWQLTRTHTYFDDALQHWSGRARSLFGEVNWSSDPGSPFFLGAQIGNNSYPLQAIIWRAVAAKLNGAWNEIISRADGLIFFIIIVGTIWLAVHRFSNSRPMAAAAAVVAATVPLHVWHAAAGYNDIALEAFVVASLAAILREEWFLAGVMAGVMAAGAVWSKNDAIFLYLPALLATVGLMNWRKGGRFLSGLATIAPWLAFNYVHNLGLAARQGEVAWHPDAPRLLWNALAKSPSSSILWISIFACVIYSCIAMFKDRIGRGLIVCFSLPIAAILFIFSSTSAFTYLNDQTTIHRVMMQFSGMAIMISTYGLGLKTNQADGRKVKVNKATAGSRQRG